MSVEQVGRPIRTVIEEWTGEYVLTPTNSAFAGAELDQLVQASLGSRALKAVDPGLRGAQLHHPGRLGRSANRAG